MNNNTNYKNLKIFFIKLVLIFIATIIAINVLFNLIISDKMQSFDILFSLTEL